MADTQPFTVLIVGGGLVGSLASLYFARRGWNVQVYEKRLDPRTDPTPSGRSINLALSVRGISALQEVGVDEAILKTAIPMKGRMIHSLDGELTSQPYGVFGEHINSIDRKLLNEHLLNSADALSNVHTHFEHEMTQCDFDSKAVSFMKIDGTKVTVKADLIIGADGAYSRVRQQMMRKVRMDFSQEYIDHEWVELTIPPRKDGSYAMNPNHLHIWPRQTFMMIALPNTDKSFTVTLFMPRDKFQSVRTESDLIRFFESTFPDAVPLIGLDLLVGEYFKNPKGSLVSIKCSPYHYQDRCVIIGDAAHAMVPFYGQGMNCGFEDIQALDEFISTHLSVAAPSGSTSPSPLAIGEALKAYSASRHKDLVKINDLAMHNYVEMRSDVTKVGYLLRKKLEAALHRVAPSYVIPLYTMVSFSRIPYSEVMRRWERQTYWLNVAGVISGVAASVGLGVAYARYIGWRLFWYPAREDKSVTTIVATKVAGGGIWTALSGAYSAGRWKESFDRAWHNLGGTEVTSWVSGAASSVGRYVGWK
ncbi:kynurenine 3-monooxygenase, mitochondrial precursor [Rhizophlyctis rosea]|uniref:Kynurenine 3-monooxygenase n=1 Tax=Rhizophlyctis rosea TaxID=64517 RepID=A0AAD5SBG0_9FUNG|nr:kynurenine 3-monooxygenase, mitochondrial precursor [Rhizophlyctis rosea]